MFLANNFDRLYEKLNISMVNVDCGVQCGKFCCTNKDETNDNAFRYLLPGEAEYLINHNFHSYAELEDFGFVIRYTGKIRGKCTCENIRYYRPFCCRMFPFRPVINEEICKVVSLVKASNLHFSACWIIEPLPEWKERAIDAWNYVLSDRDNLIFYARYYYCLLQSETFSGSYKQALQDDLEFKEKIFALPNLSTKNLWKLTNQLFKYILQMQYFTKIKLGG